MNLVAVWEVIALIAFAVTLWAAFDAWQDLRLVNRAARDDAVRLIAVSSFRSEVTTALIAGLWVAVGVAAANRWNVWPWLLIASTTLFAINAIMRRLYRRKIFAALITADDARTVVTDARDASDAARDVRDEERDERDRLAGR
jgi:hypothetical protein